MKVLTATYRLRVDIIWSNATGTPDSDPPPPNNVKRSLRLLPPVIRDGAPMGRRFGQEVARPRAAYTLGETVKATFQGANPRNNLRLEGTYVAVERRGDDGEWTTVHDDRDWFLVYTWRRTGMVMGYSEVDVDWDTAGNAVAGTYRFRYFGDGKSLFGGVKGFEGTSSQFTLA